SRRFQRSKTHLAARRAVPFFQACDLRDGPLPYAQHLACSARKRADGAKRSACCGDKSGGTRAARAARLLRGRRADMAIDLSSIGHRVEGSEHTYDWRDVSLYAQALGAGTDDLPFV